MTIDSLTWFLVAGSLIGGQLVINKNKFGYIIWILVKYDAVGVLRIFNKVRRMKRLYIPSELKDAAIQALENLGRPKQAKKLQMSE